MVLPLYISFFFFRGYSFTSQTKRDIRRSCRSFGSISTVSVFRTSPFLLTDTILHNLSPTFFFPVNSICPCSCYVSILNQPIRQFTTKFLQRHVKLLSTRGLGLPEKAFTCLSVIIFRPMTTQI